MTAQHGFILSVACAFGIAAADARAESPGANPVIEEVLVTAQHRSQAENDIGIGMSVFGQEAIAELAIEDSFDVTRHTPGFTRSDSGGAAVPVYTLRGVGFDDHQPNSSATVGMYADQVAEPYPVMTAGLRYDLERIEVLKGPQGDLYGRNTTGGAVNFIPNRPTDATGAGMVLGAGNYDTFEMRAHLNGPLGERVNGRLAGTVKSRDEGWQEDEITGERTGAWDEYGVRGMVDFHPSEALSVLVTLHTGRFEGEPQTPQSTVVLPVSNQMAAYLNSLGYYPLASLDPLMVADQSDVKASRWNRTPDMDRESSGGSVHVDWQIDGLTFSAITGYQTFERTIALDWDGTPARLLEVVASTEIESFSQELRLASPDDGRLTWLAGLYYSKDTLDDESSYDDSESPTVGFTFGSVAEQRTESTAGFGHLLWQLTDRLRLNLGGRYTFENRSIDNCTTDTGDGSAVTALMTYQALGMLTISNPGELVPGGCVHLEGVGTSSNPPAPDVRIPGMHEDEIDTDRATGRIGLDWLPADGWLVYGSVATGFKSGGYNMFSALTVDQFQPYDEETLTAFEAGFKGRLLDHRLQLSGAAFHYDYQDKQVSTFIPDQIGIFPALVGIRNVPESRITGLELGADWLVSAGLTLAVDLAYLDTEIVEYDSAFDVFGQALIDAEGAPLPNAPELSFRVNGTYEHPVPGDMLLRLSMAYTWQDESYSQISTIDPFEVDAYGLLDGRLTLDAASGRWSVALWSRNLSNEKYSYANALAQDNVVRYAGMPRTFGLAFSYNLN